MKTRNIVILLFCALLCAPLWGQSPAGFSKITTPPDSLHLSSFYTKYLNVNGIHIISSHKVPDSALYAAGRTIEAMTRMLPPKVLKAMTSINTRIGVMGRYEGTTDIPEHAYLAQDTAINWNLRARGLGGTLYLPLTTCAEENVLGYQIDKYHAEDILIHEFAHSIELIGIAQVDPSIQKELKDALEAARASGKWLNTYAGSNPEEYWAEGVQDWFNVNAEVEQVNGVHNRVNTREELKRYDPVLYGIIARYFPDTPEQISCHKKINLYNQE